MPTPNPKIITIERKPNQRLEPTDNFRQKITAGTSISFGLAAPLTGLVIRFNSRSPFAVDTIHYGETHQLTAAFDANHPANNVYKFDCKDPNATDAETSINGGEIEVLPGPLGLGN